MRNYNDDVIEDSFLVFIPALHPTHLPAVPVCVIVSGYKHLIMIVRSSYSHLTSPHSLHHVRPPPTMVAQQYSHTALLARMILCS